MNRRISAKMRHMEILVILSCSILSPVFSTLDSSKHFIWDRWELQPDFNYVKPMTDRQMYEEYLRSVSNLSYRKPRCIGCEGRPSTRQCPPGQVSTGSGCQARKRDSSLLLERISNGGGSKFSRGRDDILRQFRLPAPPFYTSPYRFKEWLL